jgi:uncharacterized protein (DUF1778 family)
MSQKTQRIEVRLSADHKALLEDAAAQRGQSLSAFVVSEALEQARRMQMTLLTRADWGRFLRLMEGDDEPTPALAKAAKRGRG